jgi:hypothetical protein
MVRTTDLEVIMAIYQGIGTASVQGRDRVMAALVAGLEIEFGRCAGEALARRFLDAEESDFLWEARAGERWLGAYDSVDAADDALNRMAIFGRLEGRWFAAVLIVDGDGKPQGTIGKRLFRDRTCARAAMAMAH